MSSPRDPAPRRSPFARRTPDDGPRASFRQLVPYLAEHRGVLAVVVALSLVGAGASLVQPLLVSQVIGLVQKGQGLGTLVWALVALVLAAAVKIGRASCRERV